LSDNSGAGPGQRVGLVLAGAAARGPFQAGALAELLPPLIAEGHRPVVLLGTSSGAITAALLAQFADQEPADAGQGVVDTWTGFGDVFTNPLYRPKPAATIAARFLGGGVADRFIDPVEALLDTTPLRQHAATVFSPARVAANITSGRVRSLAVAATVCPPASSAARSRLFVQGAPPSRTPRGNAVDVVAVALGVEHLLASAAIPVLFPPVCLDAPPGAAGYYVDGGVRLNAPFDAALAFGVDRVVVISGHSVAVPPVPPLLKSAAPPDLAAATALSMRAVLVDALGDDLQSLRRKNQRVQQGNPTPYGVVPYLLVEPPDGALAAMAAKTFHPSGLTDPYYAIGRALDAIGDGSGRDELLSLIYFNRDYAEQQVALGRQRAKDALAVGWQT
jgi:NTE family protein